MFKEYFNKDLPYKKLRNRIENVCILGYVIYLIIFLVLMNLFH